MSMITGCPACGTMFKVVADQLKISEGWVRCGHCAEVFDAMVHMQSDAVTPSGVTTAESGPAVIEVQDRPVLEQPPALLIAPAAERAEPEAAAFSVPPPFDLQPSDAQPSEVPSTWPSRSEFGPSSLPADEPSYLPVHLVRAEADAATARIDALDARNEEGAAEDLPIEDVSFVREARRKAFWRRPLVRTVAVLVVLLLAGLLAMQIAVQERDRLAAWRPGARPLLDRLCEPLGCRVGPPRRIEAIAIDSSGFAKLRADTYRLTVTLKNQAPLPVAVPALELTLTDSQDQPVLRRVLTPRELGARDDTIASAADWSASVPIAVGGSAAGLVAGYRLLAFYP